MISKYDPLYKFLLATPLKISALTLSFEQIEMVIGDKLPLSHIDHRQWWENQTDQSSRPQALAWMEAGFEVSDVYQDPNSGWVKFIRK